MNLKNQPEYMDKAIEGIDWFNTPNAPDLKFALPYIATSNYADAFLIGAWCKYWTGSIKSIRKSRGHSWLIINGMSKARRVEITNPYDHRMGIRIVEEIN